jgi:antitoxin component YwqK of YwqJK toxin-antitoxin module
MTETIKACALIALIFLYSCASKRSDDQSKSVVSMQIIDRNGFTETISNKERISTFHTTDFLTPQPFQKVLRVYGRNLGGQSTSKITSYHDNGQLWQYLEAVDGRAHGLYREWFPNAKQKIEANVVEGVADIHDLAQATWIFHGLCKVWDDQGNLLAEFDYQKGLLHKTARYFFANGKLQKMIPYEQGKIDGAVQAFDIEGNVIEETIYIKGEKSGKATSYWSPGKPLSTELFDRGQLIDASYFDRQGNCIAKVKQGQGKQATFKEGNLNALFTISDGLVEGEVQFFLPNAALHTSYTLKDGKKNGEEWEFYPSEKGKDPTPKLFLHWSDDKIQGQVKTWYPNGQMQSQREVNGNKKQGTSFAWYKSGDLMLFEEYENDLLLKGAYYKKADKKAVSKVDAGKGTATLYNSDGIFLKKVHYDKGKPQLNNDTLR